MKITTILDQIDLGSMALPEFQRGYVWNRDQVRELMQSLYRRYPIGSLLVWVTKTEQAKVRGDGLTASTTVELILDGQQRITSLYGIIRGKSPKFFDGDAQSFTGLYFHLEDEVFEFYASLKMKDNPLWINVTELMKNDVGEALNRILSKNEFQAKLGLYMVRLSKMHSIRDIELHIEKVTGEDKSIDVVVDIFNRVNSGGTKLSKGDLALAKICAGWPEARQKMKACLNRWEKAGFSFDLDWLLRNITSILTGQSMFAALKDIDTPDFQQGLIQAEKACNYLLNTISGRLGLDHNRVLGGRYAFPVMSRYLVNNGEKFQNAQQRDKLLYWYIHCFLSGRFTGSTETILNQDLKVLDGSPDALDNLIEQLRLSLKDLHIRPEDFAVSNLSSRFYPLLYLLTRVRGAKDWGDGLPLSANLLGKTNALQVHHIFPKALLYKHRYSRAEVNSVANFCFLTQATNLDISAKEPSKYFIKVEEKYPGALASQWIPMDRSLWQVEHYRAFLTERRKLLAEAANSFLEELLTKSAISVDYSTELLLKATPVVNEEDDALQQLISWLSAHNLPKPELNAEICDLNNETSPVFVDAAWPKGLQENYSQPIALALEMDENTAVILNQAGYRFFTNIESLNTYLKDYLGNGSHQE